MSRILPATAQQSPQRESDDRALARITDHIAIHKGGALKKTHG